MFKVNDRVLYGAEGACVITDITNRKIGGGTRRYYVLKPLYGGNMTLYVPTENSALEKKMRAMLSPEEAYAVIDSMPDIQCEWISDPKKRSATYNEIIANGDIKSVAGIIRTLYVKKKSREREGKTLCISDERCLKTAEHFLNSEFAAVLGIPPERVAAAIAERLDSIKN